ncbi:Mariner Mos1 transposase, partial [Stegodyphus mimosarum]
MDETWVYHHDPDFGGETSSCAKPKKLLASVFWDAKGILFIDYLQTGKTINSDYYCNLLNQLDEKIRERRPGLQKKIIFRQDNAPAHTAQKTIAKITELKYELLQHPAYSPDLAPSDFWLLPHLKQYLSEKDFLQTKS